MVVLESLPLCMYPCSLTAGNGNLSGSSTADSGGADLSSASSIIHHRVWGSLVNYLLFAIPLLL